jgi:hypothetical protein
MGLVLSKGLSLHGRQFGFLLLAAAVVRVSSCKSRASMCFRRVQGVVSNQLSRQGAGSVAHLVPGAHLFPLQVYGHAVSTASVKPRCKHPPLIEPCSYCHQLIIRGT